MRDIDLDEVMKKRVNRSRNDGVENGSEVQIEMMKLIGEDDEDDMVNGGEEDSKSLLCHADNSNHDDNWNATSFLPLSIRFQNISLRAKPTNKVILDEVSGTMTSGRMLAIMGGSGSGKSSLMVRYFSPSKLYNVILKLFYHV